MEVCLISEGTYPYYDGGVSVWCDQLVTGLSTTRFHIDAITTTGQERHAWKVPANVASVRSVPLWGSVAVAHPERKVSSAVRYTMEPFFRSVMTGTPDEFMAGLKQLHRLARDGRLAESLLNETTAGFMLDAMAAAGAGNREIAERPAPPTIADAIVSLQYLEHFLRPLAVEPAAVDLCHATCNGLSALVAMSSKWERGTPFLLTEHGVYLRERFIAFGPGALPHHQRAFLLGFYKQLTAAAYAVADVIAPGSEYNRRWEQANGADDSKIRPIYNGIDTLEFNTPAKEPEVPTLAWVGRIDPLKDVKTLLRAFSRVRDSVPDARLRIYGGTPKGNEEYRQECQLLHDRLGLGDSAVFEGRVPSIIDAYHSGHAVLSTSISEGFPYAVLEAMAAGRAMVATNVGGIPEAIADTGLMVGPGDHVALAEACVTLLADDERRTALAEAGRQRVLSLFTLDMCLDQYRELYDWLAWSSTTTLTWSATHTKPVSVIDQAAPSDAPYAPDHIVAPLGGQCPQPAAGAEPDGDSAKAWLARVSSEPEPAAGADDPALAQVCASAVDPLEIAAGLEVAGISHRVVTETYGLSDVFALAEQLWRKLPFRATQVVTPPIWRRGNFTDLGRGLLYGAPSLMLFALSGALRLHPDAWALPLALTCGWALGQGTSFVTYQLRSCGVTDGDGEVGSWALMTAIVVTTLLAVGAVRATGGDWASVVLATSVTTFMVASALLVTRNREALGALLLAPGVLAALSSVIDGSLLPRSVVATAVVGSAVATLAVAASRMRLSTRAVRTLRRHHLWEFCGHVTHGLLCGLALSLVAIDGSQILHLSVNPAVLAMPLLATLGIMEWQLRTFRASVAELTAGLHSVDQFPALAWRRLLYSVQIYLIGLEIVSLTVEGFVGAMGHGVPMGLLVAQIVLGLVYFLDLTVLSLGRLDLVLESWAAGTLAGVLVAALLAGGAPSSIGVLVWRASIAATATTLVMLTLRARQVVTLVMSHG